MKNKLFYFILIFFYFECGFKKSSDPIKKYFLNKEKEITIFRDEVFVKTDRSFNSK